MSEESRGSVGYRAALNGAGVLLREELGFLQVTGSAPGDMLKGILSGRIPLPLGRDGGGDYAYSAILTPKGKMVTDLHLLPLLSGGFLLVLPKAGMEGALNHFRKYLHPKFAQLQERTEDLSYLSLEGPTARSVAAQVLELKVADLPGPGRVLSPSSSPGDELFVVGSQALGLEAVHLILPPDRGEITKARALECGAEPMDAEDLDTLRIESGRPLFGVDMTPDTIPIEAGIQEDCIDYEKGCYTGQEVIIRLRDRGQVNKRLSRILLGPVAPPPSGTELFLEDSGKKAGWVTSSCTSPRFGQTIALGFIKRGVEVGTTVKLGGPQGSDAQVSDLR